MTSFRSPLQKEPLNMSKRLLLSTALFVFSACQPVDQVNTPPSASPSPAASFSPLPSSTPIPAPTAIASSTPIPTANPNTRYGLPLTVYAANTCRDYPAIRIYDLNYTGGFVYNMSNDYRDPSVVNGAATSVSAEEVSAIEAVIKAADLPSQAKLNQLGPEPEACGLNEIYELTLEGNTQRFELREGRSGYAAGYISGLQNLRKHLDELKAKHPEAKHPCC